MVSFRKIKFTLLFLLLLALLAPFTVNTTKAAQLTWTVETVDAAIHVGKYTSIALDSNDRPHISYYDEWWGDLKYSRWNGTSWEVYPIATVGNVGLYSSLALDSDDNPHISYFDLDTRNLIYYYHELTNVSVTITAIVDSDGNVGQWSSLAVDSNNRPHIAYYDYTNFDLKYASWNGTWEIETVDSNGDVGRYSSLALDSNNRPHIVYLDRTNLDLKYASWNGAAWEIETVDSDGNVGWYCSLALDSNDNPHISYSDNGNVNLKYAKKTGTSWMTETVDASNQVGGYTSIAIDSNDLPHISYYDWHWSDLKYAKMTAHGWFIKNVDNVGQIGIYTSIALDSEDHPHISYQDGDSKNLKYTRDPDETIFSVAYEALDSNGDLQNDGVKVTFDVDTTFDGTLPVFVYAHLTDNTGRLWATNTTLISITWLQSELTDLTLTIPQAAPQDLYSIYVVVEDESLTLEDVFYLQDEIALYPPTTPQGGTLEGTVTDFDTQDPIGFVEIQINGYTAYTNSSGQYSIGLPAGTYNVTASEELYSSQAIQGVTIINGTTTTQNIVLEKSHYILELQVEGSGTLNPSAGAYSYLIGSEIEVQATPESGWTLAYWLLDLTNVGAENPYVVNMDSNHVLKAVFVEEANIGFLHGTVSDVDSGLPIGEAEVSVGNEWFLTNSTGNYALELEPGEYVVTVGGVEYHFQEALVTIVAEGTTVQDFALERISRTLAIEADGSGTTDPTPGEHQIPSGSEVLVTATPERGWMLNHWLFDSVNIGSENPIGVLMDRDHVLVAVFSEEPTPSPTPSPSPSPTPGSASSPTPTPSPSPIESPSPTTSPSVTPTPTASPSETPTPEPQPSESQPFVLVGVGIVIVFAAIGLAVFILKKK
jgi:hypothetical protein